MTWSLQLFTGSLNKKISLMEKKLTDASDQLDILETEALSLKENWEGASSEEWYAELLKSLKETKEQLQEMRILLASVLALAEKLVTVEQRNRSRIEEMKV